MLLAAASALVRVIAVVMLAPVLQGAAAPAACTFHPAREGWRGGCGRVFDGAPVFTLAPAAAVRTGAWRADAAPIAVWAGIMSDSDHAHAPVELEVYPGDSGVLRTPYGWFAVSGLARSEATLTFGLDTARDVPPNGLDRRIVERAAAILSSPAVWNRADTRRCPEGATTWSLYCAMEAATVDVTGGFHHRRPALQVVRRLVQARSAGRDYEHRLMDWNNDSRTRFEDLQQLFRDALERMPR